MRSREGVQSFGGAASGIRARILMAMLATAAPVVAEWSTGQRV
jgi:hypothetical protein